MSGPYPYPGVSRDPEGNSLQTSEARMPGIRFPLSSAATAFLLLSSPTFAQTTEVPITAVLQAPFVASLSAAPARGALAFVLREGGSRNLYLAEPPAYTPKKLTAYDKDDGTEITDLAWSKDALSLLFVRGGDPNRRGERPNPTSNPLGVKQQVHLMNLQTGDIRLVGEGHDPVVSVNGDQIFLVSTSGELFAAPFAGGDAKSILKTRGGISQVTLSPDGRRIAFANRRGDHGFVGVYDLETQTVTHPDPSVDTDTDPVFSPDGRRLAFLRQAADSQALPFEPVREAEPWSVIVHDFRTGVSRHLRHPAQRAPPTTRLVLSVLHPPTSLRGAIRFGTATKQPPSHRYQPAPVTFRRPPAFCRSTPRFARRPGSSCGGAGTRALRRGR